MHLNIGVALDLALLGEVHLSHRSRRGGGVLKKGMREKRGARGVRETLGHGGNGMSFFWREGI